MNEIIEYKNLDWYVMQETEKEKLIILKDNFTNKQSLKYFAPELVSETGGVAFNSDVTKIWWEDSEVREGLNGPFLRDLNKEDLNIIRTTLSLDGEERTTEDYVRLITVDEVEKLIETKIEILRTKKDWYWTMNPSNFYIGYAGVFFVRGSSTPGYLNNAYVNYSDPGVRPVISLKSDNLTSKEIDEEQLKNILIEMIWKLNNKVDITMWIEYNKRFNSLLKVSTSKEILMLLDLLGKTLLKTTPILENCSKFIIRLVENLNHTKKLLKI